MCFFGTRGCEETGKEDLMAGREVIYIEPQERPIAPLGMRIRAMGVLLQECLFHPRTTLIIGYDVPSNKIIVKRERKLSGH